LVFDANRLSNRRWLNDNVLLRFGTLTGERLVGWRRRLQRTGSDIRQEVGRTVRTMS
jgi:hypothetical protein